MNIRSNPDTTRPAVTTGPLASSRKIFATPDAAPDLRVPLREIILSEAAGEPNRRSTTPPAPTPIPP
jgi:phosphomethylpyrimidine synthase